MFCIIKPKSTAYGTLYVHRQTNMQQSIVMTWTSRSVVQHLTVICDLYHEADKKCETPSSDEAYVHSVL